MRLETDRLGGTTYSYSNLNDFLANRAQQIQYLGDVSAPSVFNGGATGPRHAQSETFGLYAQDEWRVNGRLSLNLGLRYDYFRPLREADDLQVVFDPVNGILRPSNSSALGASRRDLQPRLSFTWTPTDSGKTLLRGGFSLLSGPGQVEDQIQPIESDRVSVTQAGGAFPLDTAALVANFAGNPLTSDNYFCRLRDNYFCRFRPS